MLVCALRVARRRAGGRLRLGAARRRRVGDGQHLLVPRTLPRSHGPGRPGVGGGRRRAPRAGRLGLGERPSWLAWLGVAVALPGIWLVSRGSTASGAGTPGALADGVAAGAGFGVLFIALAQIPSHAGFLPLAANQLFGAACTVIVAAALGQQWRPRRGVLPWAGASGALGATGTLTFLLSTHATDLGVAAVLTSLYPAVTCCSRPSCWGERLGSGQRLGIGICTLAVATLAIG